MNSVTCGGKGDKSSRMKELGSPSTPETPPMDSPRDHEERNDASDSSRTPRSTTPSDSDDLAYDLAALGFTTPPRSAPHPDYENVLKAPEPHGFEDDSPYEPNYVQFGPCNTQPPPYMALPEQPADMAIAINYILATGLLQTPQLDYQLAGFVPPSSPPPSYAHVVPNFLNLMTPFGDPEGNFNHFGGEMFGPPPGPFWIPPMPPGSGGCGGYYHHPPPPPPPWAQAHHHHPIYNMGMPMPPGFQDGFPGFAQSELLDHFQVPFQPPPPPYRAFNGNGMFAPYPPPPVAPWTLPPMPPSTPPAQIRAPRPMNPYAATFFPRTLASLGVRNPGEFQERHEPQQQSLLGPFPLHYRLDPPVQTPERMRPKVEDAGDPSAAPYVSNMWDSAEIGGVKPPPSNFVYYVPPRVDDDDYFGGQIQVWQDKMVATFAGFTPDVWTLQGLPEFNKHSEGGWSYFTITCKLRFCCRKCMRPWTSMRGKVHFAFKWDSDLHKGTIFMKIFGQVCNRENCADRRFQTPACYPEEIHRVLLKLSEYIGFIHYGLPLSSKFYSEPDKAIRLGNPRSPHRPALCQACQQGICSRMP